MSKAGSTPLSDAVGEQLTRLSEAARKSHLSVATLRNMIASGQLTGYRVGPKLIFVDEVELAGIVRKIGGAA
ncbi:MAG: helix-turn-helix domain-containing protein [Nocardiaceae bacterium]|nr:helix-turn-helix domain-containing protein [Nocardiaceae bacterium]